MEIYRLYPQFNDNDRRQNNICVDVERRTNIDKKTQFASDFGFIDKKIDPGLKKDIEEVKDVFKKFRTDNNSDTSITQDIEVGAASSIPYFRRIRGIANAVGQQNYIKALGLGFLQFINVKEDWRDIAKIFSKPNTPRDFQIPFSFIRGTPLEKFEILRKFDKPFDKTEIGKKLLKILGVNNYQIFMNGRMDKFGNPIFAHKAEGRLLMQVIARSFMRIPVLSLAFLSLLEIPSIIKSKEHVKQTAKSAINVTSVIAGGALLGAIGAYLGPLGSLAGLGIGSYYAGKVAKKINSNIN